MRSISVASLVAAGAALPIVAALACTPSSTSSDSDTAANQSDDDWSLLPESTDTVPSSPEPAKGDVDMPPEKGDVDLPPEKAPAWNAGQSDGKPGKVDRGVKDYQKIISDSRDKFRSCYDAALAKRKGIQGRVTLEWVLDPKGSIKDGARLDPKASDFQDEFLEKCMVAALKSLSFPPSTRGMDSTVRYPFHFNPLSRPGK